MKRSDINEPILLQSKENRTEDYISLSFMLLLAGFGLYNFIANRDVSLLAICLLYFVFQFYMMYRGDSCRYTGSCNSLREMHKVPQSCLPVMHAATG